MVEPKGGLGGFRTRHHSPFSKSHSSSVGIPLNLNPMCSTVIESFTLALLSSGDISIDRISYSLTGALPRPNTSREIPFLNSGHRTSHVAPQFPFSRCCHTYSTFFLKPSSVGLVRGMHAENSAVLIITPHKIAFLPIALYEDSQLKP